MTPAQIIQLVATIVAPIVAAGGALWIASLSRQERGHAFIDWKQGHEGFAPYIGIHNRSAQAIYVTDVRLVRSRWGRGRDEYTALDFEDPDDLPFPAEIPAGVAKRYRLDEQHARIFAARASRLANWASRRFRRHRFYVRAQTTSGRRFYVGGEEALRGGDRYNGAGA